MSESSTAATLDRAPFWHYVPLDFKRTDDVVLFTQSLEDTLAPWFIAALTRKLRFLPVSYSGSGGDRPKHADEVSSDIAHALMQAREWDGFQMAQLLFSRGWPADADLVQRCHRWSCDLERRRRDAWKAKKAAAAEKKKR